MQGNLGSYRKLTPSAELNFRPCGYWLSLGSTRAQCAPPVIESCDNVELSMQMGFLVGEVTFIAHGVCGGLAGPPDRHRDQ